ncbi:MAG: HNH endonuclease [Eubacteriales bacterium]|nr:HNH endonuclease [Eubacteriales bacterium]
MRRDKYLCQDCKRYGRNKPAVVAHHIEPITERPELAYVLSNRRALCDACHNKRHPEKGGRSR